MRNDKPNDVAVGEVKGPCAGGPRVDREDGRGLRADLVPRRTIFRSRLPAFRWGGGGSCLHPSDQRGPLGPPVLVQVYPHSVGGIPSRCALERMLRDDPNRPTSPSLVPWDGAPRHWSLAISLFEALTSDDGGKRCLCQDLHTALGKAKEPEANTAKPQRPIQCEPDPLPATPSFHDGGCRFTTHPRKVSANGWLLIEKAGKRTDRTARCRSTPTAFLSPTP